MPRTVDHSQTTVNRIASRKTLSKRLNRFMEPLAHACITHFAAFDVIRDCPGPCDNLNDQAQWSDYGDFKDHFHFAPYTYCFHCGIPNDSNSSGYFQPQCHLRVFPTQCKWKGLVFKTLFLLWSRRYHEARSQIFQMHGIPADITLSEFGAWAAEDLAGNVSHHYYNGLNVFLNFCEWTLSEEHAFDEVRML